MLTFHDASRVLQSLVPSEFQAQDGVRALVTWSCSEFLAKGIAELKINQLSTQSSLAWFRDDWSDPPRNRPHCVKMGTGRADITIVWDLVHELGHASIPPLPIEPLDNESKYKRESEAWELAWEYVETHAPSLAKHEDSFLAHKDQCLKTHQCDIVVRRS